MKGGDTVLRFMPEWWSDVMMWMDTSYVPLYVVLIIALLYFAVRLWHDTRWPPPPSDQ